MKTIQKNIAAIMLLVVSIMVINLQANAQFQRPEQIQLSQLRSKTLMVVLLEPSTQYLKDNQQNRPQVDLYMNAIQKFNDMLAEVATNHYHYGKKVLTVKENQIQAELKKPTGPKMAFLQYELIIGQVTPNMLIEMYSGDNTTNELRKKSIAEGYSKLSVYMPGVGADRKLERVMYIPMQCAYPTKGDLTFAVQNMDRLLAVYQKKPKYELDEFKTDVDANNPYLFKRMLLIDVNMIDPDLTDEKAHNYYRGKKLQLVDYAKVNEAIVNQDSGFAYVMVLPASPDKYGAKIETMHLVVDAKDGKILGRSKPTRMAGNKVALNIGGSEIQDYLTK